MTIITNSIAPVVTDHDITTADGIIFARRWQPQGVEGGQEAAGDNAPTILLFHDSLGSVALWRDFPEKLALATGLPVIAYDRLGFGQSDANPHILKPSFMMDEAEGPVAALRAQLGVTRFIAFGHSVGGAMAVASASLYAQDCLAVITESSQAFVEDRTLQGIYEAQVNFADPAQIARLARYHGDKTQWVLDAWMKTWLADNFADWTMDSMLANARAPLLAMHGDLDEFGSSAHPDRIANESGGPFATLCMFEQTGHVPHREKPDIVLETVTDFLCKAGVIA